VSTKGIKSGTCVFGGHQSLMNWFCIQIEAGNLVSPCSHLREVAKGEMGVKLSMRGALISKMCVWRVWQRRWSLQQQVHVRSCIFVLVDYWYAECVWEVLNSSHVVHNFGNLTTRRWRRCWILKKFAGAHGFNWVCNYLFIYLDGVVVIYVWSSRIEPLIVNIVRWRWH